MRVLITGAAGFIGRPLVQRLAQEHEVYGLVRRPSTVPRSIQMDLGEGIDDSRLPEQVDVVMHLAQSGHYREFPEQAADIYRVNVQSTFQLLEYARKAHATRFILASSGGVYGYAPDPMIESGTPHPPDFYLASKHLAEILQLMYDRFYAVIAVRPFFVYGQGQRPNMFIPRLVRNVLLGRPITLSPPDGLRVNPIHLSDAVEAFAATLNADHSGPINVAGPGVLTLGEMIRLIGDKVGREPVVERTPEAPGNVVADIALMSRILGPPTVPFSRGVVEVCREVAAELATEER